MSNSDEKYKRPTWDEYFMEVCRTIAKRATCDRGRSGCVIAKDNRILVTGYPGVQCEYLRRGTSALSLLPSFRLHSVQRVLFLHSVALLSRLRESCFSSSDLLHHSGEDKMTPCRTCAMLIINCGIKRVVCEKHYHDEADSMQMFRDAGIHIEHLEDSVQTYENM